MQDASKPDTAPVKDISSPWGASVILVGMKLSSLVGVLLEESNAEVAG